MFIGIKRRKDFNSWIKCQKLLMVICIVVFGISACGTTNNDVEIQAEKIVEAVENNDMKMLEKIMLGTEDFVADKELADFFEDTESANNGIIAKIVEQDSIKVKKITEEHIVYQITAPELSNIFEEVMKEENITEDNFEQYIYNYIERADKTKLEVKVPYTYEEGIFTADYSTQEFMNGITGNLITAYQELIQQMIETNSEEDVK